MRVRLFRRAGVQGAAGRGLPGRARELESGHDHDRSGVRRSHLHRADHARGDRSDHRTRKAGRHPADDGRPDRAERRDGTESQRRAREAQRAPDRRQRPGDRERRRSPAFQGSDAPDRPRCAALRHCPLHRRCRAGRRTRSAVSRSSFGRPSRSAGSGGGIAYNREELEIIVDAGSTSRRSAKS